MCSLFGSNRDSLFIKGINRELIHNVISQQCAFYKYRLNETQNNIYGEASGEKFFNGPTLFNALITLGDNTSPTDDNGVDFNWPITFAFLKDDLIEASLVPEVGDVILYQESYWEIDNANEVQLWFGKDPNYPYNNQDGTNNPLNPNLDKFGYNVSIICTAHYVPEDRINIQKARL